MNYPNPLWDVMETVSQIFPDSFFRPTHFPRVRFKNGRWGDMELYLCKNYGQNDAPIATLQQYRNFCPSQAHLSPDGIIWCHHESIGTREDLFIWWPLQIEN
jgi:hypothetical protein